MVNWNYKVMLKYTIRWNFKNMFNWNYRIMLIYAIMWSYGIIKIKTSERNYTIMLIYTIINDVKLINFSWVYD